MESLSKFLKRTRTQKRMDTALVQRMSKLFPAAISNVGTYAFGAYDEPHGDIGFDETTTNENIITYLKWDWVANAMEGVLKIQLESAQNLRNSDTAGQGNSDPYVVFTHGGCYVKSETKYDTQHPEYNSTHYLVLRKMHLEPETDEKVRIAVFDKDTRSGAGSILNWLDKDDHLGAAELTLKAVKKTGVHKYDLILHDNEYKKTEKGKEPRVKFTTEFMSVEKAFEEMGLGKDSPKWLERDPSIKNDTDWTGLAKMTDIGQIDLEKVAYIDGKNTGTQVWIHANTSSKVVVVAFRGTEMTRLKDILADITFMPSGLSASARSDSYVMKTSKVYLDEQIKLHRGFKRAYDDIRESVLRIVYDLTHWSDQWTVLVTGHSLGGALATLCAFELENRTLSSTLNSLKTVVTLGTSHATSKPKIGMMNFGAPRVGNIAFVEVYNHTVTESLRIVNANDLVHFLPPILFSHTKFEVLLQDNGEVELENVVMQSGNYTDDVARALEAGEIKEEELNEKAFTRFSVLQHLGSYYFKLAEAAMQKFHVKAETFRESMSKGGDATSSTPNN